MKERGCAGRVCIILNPHADKGGAERRRSLIENACREYRLDYVVVETHASRDAIGFARSAVHNGFNTIVAAGGDGTANEVLDGMVRGIRECGLTPENSPCLGILPVGRGNDFAWVAGIPDNVTDAVALIAEGNASLIDYGELKGGSFPQGRCFLNGVGIGFEPTVNYIASDFKHVSGMLSYVLALIKVMMNYPKAAKLKVLLDNSDTIEIDTQQMSICNGRRMGAAFIMAPEAVVDDGLLDLVYANRPVGILRILSLVLRFFKGTQLSTPYFSMQRVKSLRISDEESKIVCHADGEEISRGCENIEIEIFPKGLNCIRKRQT